MELPSPDPPRSESSRFAPVPREKNYMPAGKTTRKQSEKKGVCMKYVPPWGAAEGGALPLLFLVAFLMSLLAGVLFLL